MAGEVVGSVYVRVRAITSQLANDIQDGLDKGVREVNLGASSNELGTDVGSDFVDGFEETVDGAIPDRVKGVFTDLNKKHKRAFNKSGSSVGDQWGRGFAHSLRSRIRESYKTFDKDLSKFSQRFNALVDKFKIPLKPILYALAIPAIAKALQALTLYVVGLVGMIGYLSTALAGGAVAVAGFFGGMLAAIPPIILGFKTMSPELLLMFDRAKKVGKQFETVGLAVQEHMLPAINAFLDDVVVLIPTLTDFGRAIGLSVAKFIEMMRQLFFSEEGMRRIRIVFDQAAYAFDQGVEALGYFIEVLVNLWAAADPITRDFSERLKNLFKRWAETTRLGEADGSLTRTLETWYIRAVYITQAFGDMFAAIWNTFKVGADVSQPFFDTFKDWASNWRAFTESDEGKDRIREVFEIARPAVQELNGLIRDLFVWLYEASVDPENAQGIAGFISTLRTEFIPWIRDNFVPAFEPLKEPLKNLLDRVLDLSRALQEYQTLEKVIQILSIFLDIITKLLGIPGFGTFLSYLIVFSVTMGSIGRVAGPAIQVFSAIVRFAAKHGLVSKLGAALRVAGSGAVAFAGQIGAAFGLSGGAAIAAGAAVIIAAVLAIYLVFRNWDTIVGWLDTAWDAVYRFFTELPGKIASGAAAIVRGIQKVPGFIVDSLSKVPELLGQLGGLLAEAVGGLAEFVVEGLISVTEAIANWSVDLAKKIPGFLVEAVSALGEFIIKAVPAIVKGLAYMVGFIIGALLALAVGIPIYTAKLVILLVGWIGKAAGKAVSAIAGFIDAIWDAIYKFATRDLPKFAAEAGPKLWGWIKEAVPQAISAVGGFVSSTTSAILDFVASIPGLVQDAAGHLLSWMVEAARNAPGMMVDLITSITEQIGTWGAQLISAGANLATDVFDWVSTAVTNVPTKLGELLSAIADFFVSLPGELINALKDFANAVAEAIGEGLTDALESIPGGKYLLEGADWVIDLFTTNLEPIKPTLDMGGIQSPRVPVTLDALSSALDVPGFAAGGYIQSRKNGLIARLGEGGFDEIVLTTDPSKQRSNEELLAMAGIGQGDRFDIKVYEAQNGMQTASDIIRRVKTERYLYGGKIR